MNNILEVKKHINKNNLFHYSISGFNTSYGVGVNKDGDIYIPDFKLGYIFLVKKNFKEIYALNFRKDRLKKVNFFNKFIFNKILKIRGNFNRIHDIYFDEQDNMYVVDMGLGKNMGQGLLYIFDQKLNLLKKIGLDFHYKKGMISPVMSSNNKNQIFITEWGASKIILYNNEFKFLGWIGSFDKISKEIKSDYWIKEKQILNISLNKPHAIKFDEYNNIYIVDSNNHRIIKLSENFEYQGFIGKYSEQKTTSTWRKEYEIGFKGDDLGAFNTPVGLEIYKNFIYVADCFNNRIVKINLDGETYGILSFDKINNYFYWSKDNKNKINLNNPYGITIVDENLYIADKNNHKIEIISLKNII